MLNLITRYASVGLLNTFIHWVVFTLLVFSLKSSQALANLIAFLVAVTFSFFANSKWTFRSSATPFRYFIFVAFMGFIALLTGYIADKLHLPILVTLIIFSSLSLFLGFMFSNFVVFRSGR